MRTSYPFYQNHAHCPDVFESQLETTSFKEDANVIEDPGPIPVDLLHVPGFISDVMDYTLSTAPYPEKTLAFGGALTLQGLLAGRKVRDEADNVTHHVAVFSDVC